MIFWEYKTGGNKDKANLQPTTVCINPDHIVYVAYNKGGVDNCEIHLVNGDYITVKMNDKTVVDIQDNLQK